MKAKITVGVLTVVLILYFVLIGDKALIFIREGTVVGWGLAVAAVLLPIVGAVLLAFELRFGWRTQHMGRELAAQGGLPEASDLPTTPSGRIDKKAAAERFDVFRHEAEAAPDDWRSWFRLADAYDVAGDRKRARGSMRKAIELRYAKETS
ncbi:hypothetical protein EH165_07945 [Nakamurella antarctica]|uniref:Tetratricopeptide repeat-containing protein n=1 Tax=Nakamurella antarctica TaxID=1902245 RepID=A0A3G8ZWM1_9ACTN|nr:hypothetical protein [Nakamurella antarctica]AZI58081.1 hypothetical protein EH165_07945 [Nakamurella antarctica]